MKPVLLIFVKVPQIGRTKTRLAADLGAAAACCFYRRLSLRLIHRLSGPKWQTILLVTPDQSAEKGRHWPRRLRGGRRLCRRRQGDGDLGQRMARAIAHFAHAPVVLVGSDIPGMEADDIAAAFKALGRHQAVFGPAFDGGYWLIGFRRGKLAQRRLRQVRWSSNFALQDTLAGLPAHWRVAHLQQHQDIDTAADLKHWQRKT